jgi:hypothetical protein
MFMFSLEIPEVLNLYSLPFYLKLSFDQIKDRLWISRILFVEATATKNSAIPSNILIFFYQIFQLVFLLIIIKPVVLTDSNLL